MPALWTWTLYTATYQRELQISGSRSTRCRSQSGNRLCSVSWALTVYKVAVEPATMAHACDMVWQTPYRASESPSRSCIPPQPQPRFPDGRLGRCCPMGGSEILGICVGRRLRLRHHLFPLSETNRATRDTGRIQAALKDRASSCRHYTENMCSKRKAYPILLGIYKIRTQTPPSLYPK